MKPVRPTSVEESGNVVKGKGTPSLSFSFVFHLEPNVNGIKVPNVPLVL